jgi:hypothetical protein
LSLKIIQEIKIHWSKSVKNQMQLRFTVNIQNYYLFVCWASAPWKPNILST